MAIENTAGNTATLEAPAAPVDLGASQESDWGSMSKAEKKADVNKAYEAVKAKYAEAVDDLDDDSLPPAPETPAPGEETPAADDAAPAASAQDEEVDRSWLDADTQDLATALGLTDADLAEFGSKAELDRALRLIDRKAFEAGKAAQQPPPAKPADQPPAQTPAAQRTEDALAKLKAFKLDEELGSDDAPKLQEAISAITAELEDFRAWRDGIRKTEGQRAFQDLRTKATNALHSLGHVDLFGKPGEAPTKEQAANVEKALDAHFTHARGLIASGRNAAPTPAFLKAAVGLVFADQLVNSTKQQQIAKLKAQSARRTGGGTTKPTPAEAPSGETTRQSARRIAADPEVQAAWRKLAGAD